MIGRFVTWLVLFVIVTGLILHFRAELPVLSSWIGHLPGDLVIKKGDSVIYLPLTTSGILAVLCTIMTSGFKKNQT